MFKELRNYILDNEFRINIYNNKVNIVNYIDVLILEEERVTIKYNEGIVVIKGKNLILNKLLDQEILITGNIKTIELE